MKPVATGGRIAIVGGLGYLGGHIARRLVADGWNVTVFDKLYAARDGIAEIRDAVRIEEGDMSRAEDVLGAIAGAEVIIDLIHSTVPGSSMRDPYYDVISNVAARVRWLERLRETSVKKILYVSSGGTVYGRARSIPIPETHPTDPISSYGITKLCSEKYVAMYSEIAGLDWRILRPANVFGPGQKLHIGQGVIGVFADSMLSGRPITLWSSPEAVRDYLFVTDFVDAVAALLSYNGEERIFNVSSEQGRTLTEVLAALEKIIGVEPELEIKAVRGTDVPANVLDSSLLKRETGWAARADFEFGLRKVVAWLRARGSNP